MKSVGVFIARPDQGGIYQYSTQAVDALRNIVRDNPELSGVLLSDAATLPAHLDAKQCRWAEIPLRQIHGTGLFARVLRTAVATLPVKGVLFSGEGGLGRTGNVGNWLLNRAGQRMRKRLNGI